MRNRLMSMIHVLLFVALLSSACGGRPASAGDPSGPAAEPTAPLTTDPVLSAVLEAPATLSEGATVPLTYTLINETAEPLYVVAWFTPLQGVTNDLFDVTRDGENVEYDGLMATPAEPTPESYILVEAEGSVSVTVDLAEFYDVSQAGEYTIAYRKMIFSHIAHSEEEMAETMDDLTMIPIASNTVTLTVSRAAESGQASEAEPALEPDLETYTNATYGFAFRYPGTWSVMSMTDHGVSLARGRHQLTIAFRDQGEAATFPWSGLPAGDLRHGGTLPFMGDEIDRHELVYEGKVKVITYEAAVEALQVAIRLDDAVETDYDAIDIPEEVQRDADQIVASFEAAPPARPSQATGRRYPDPKGAG